MGLLIAALIVGAVASAGAGILARVNERQEATQQAQYDKEQNALDIQAAEQKRDSILGEMSRELEVNRQNDFRQAHYLERGSAQQFMTSMQEAYLGQRDAESKHMDTIAGTTQEMGQLNAAMGASGARADTTLATVIGSEQRRLIAENRARIDAGRDYSVAAGEMNVLESRQRATDIRANYNEGSAYMDLYNFKRQSVIDATATDISKMNRRDSYLDKIVEDNKYNLKWALADVFGVAGAAAGAVAGWYQYGLYSTKPKTRMLDNYEW